MSNKGGYHMASSGSIANDVTPSVIPIGPEIPWPETVNGITDALLHANRDVDGFVLLLRVAALLYRLRAPASMQKTDEFASIAADIYESINVRESGVVGETS